MSNCQPISKPKKQNETVPQTPTSDVGEAIHPAFPRRPLHAKIVGIGGAGIALLGSSHSQVTRCALQGEYAPEILALDTDAKALSRCRVGRKIHIGQSLTHGLGAAGDPATGRRAAEVDAEPLREALLGADLVILLMGVGGGTGSGAAPFVAQLAQQTSALTVAVTVLPFEFEPETRRTIAAEVSQELRGICDATLEIRHDALFEKENAQATAEVAFQRSASLAAQAVRSLLDLFTLPGMGEISLDDIRKAWGSTQSKLAFGWGQADAESDGENRAATAIQRALSTPTCTTEILASANQLFVLMQGFDLRLTETMAITEQLKRLNPKARVSLCAAPDTDTKDSCRVVVFAAQPASATSLTPNRLPSKYGAFGTAVGSLQLATPPRQQTLDLESHSRGRFEKSEPTIYEGEDLDVPTYIRRNIRV